MLAVALLGLQPTITPGHAPVFALSDAFVILTLMANIGSMPRLPDAVRAPTVLIGLALVVGWLDSAVRGANGVLPWASVRVVGYFLLVMYVIFAYHYGKDPTFVRSALRGFVFVTLIVNVLVLQWMPTRSLVGRFVPVKFPSRLSGGLFDPNANGAALACCVLLVALGGSFVVKHVFARGLTFVLLSYCLVQTFSRGALVALLIAVIAVAVVSLRKRPAILATAVFVGAVTFVFLDAIGVVAGAITQLHRRPASSLSDRVFFIQDAIHAFVADPLLGSGLGSATARNGAVVHASFFWLLGDVGIVGALGFGLFLLANLRMATTLIAGNKYLGIAGALVAMCVACFSFEAMYQRQWWVLVGFAVALSRPSPRSAK